MVTGSSVIGVGVVFASGFGDGGSVLLEAKRDNLACLTCAGVRAFEAARPVEEARPIEDRPDEGSPEEGIPEEGIPE